MSPTRKTNLCLSLVFSFRNEQEVLPELVKRTRDVIKAEQANRTISEYELIFVNDRSSDDSLKILLELAQDLQDIKIINMSRPFGVAPCVLAGLEYAKGDIAIYMDADLQDPPEIIHDMIKAWQENDVDVVNTIRLSRKGESALKLFITKIGYWILHHLTIIHLPDNAGDFKLLSRRVVNQLILCREKRPFIRGLICWIGFSQMDVTYHRDARFAGETKFPVLSLSVFSNFFESAIVSFSSFLLHFSSIAGLVASLIGGGLLVHVLIEKLHGHNIPGWTALMVTIIFLGSIQLFCLGIIGLYIKNIHEQGTNRPNYIIDSTFGFNIDQRDSSME